MAEQQKKNFNAWLLYGKAAEAPATDAMDVVDVVGVDLG